MMDKCKKCAFKYGTLACCTTVSNEWVYSCKEGMDRYKEKTRKKEKKYSVLVCIETSEQFYQEYDSREEAEKIFNRFLDVLSNDEDETTEEIEEEADEEIKSVWCHTVRLYLHENKKIITDYDFDISDDICSNRGYYEELL